MAVGSVKARGVGVSDVFHGGSDSRAICKAPAAGRALRILEPTSGFEPLDLRITSALLYQLSHVGESASCEAAVQ